MSKHEKAIRRILSDPKDFAWPELVNLMSSFGIELSTSSGSARKFRNPATGEQLNMHQPHPSNILKRYQVRDAIGFLKQEGFLNGHNS
jgi:hypothetical protein